MKNSKKYSHYQKNRHQNTTLDNKDKFILIPQNNKYINIYNTYQQQTPAQTDRNGPQVKKVHRLIVRKPTSDHQQQNQDNSDELLNNIFGSIFAGLSSDQNNSLNMFGGQKSIEKNTAGLDKTSPEIIIPKIDRDRLKFLDEKPKTLEELIFLGGLIGVKYDVNDYYNIDLERLKNVLPALEKLAKMIGLTEIKSKIVDIILYYLQRLDIKNQDMLHTIIDGAPGSGKTEIAQIYCDILRGLGVLSKGTFRKAKKHDLIGGYLGHTAMKTMKLLEEIKGGVLFIDEIYSFGSSAGKDSKDIYAKECVDLLMEFMSENKSDFVLVVAGYREDIERFFLSMNDGLERRFPIHLSITEYNEEEMRQIFIKKVAELNWKINDDAIPKEFFKDNKEYFKYYGGDMETLLSKCKYSHSRNLLENHQKIHRVIDKKDFVDGFELYRKNPEIEKRKETPKYLSFYT